MYSTYVYRGYEVVRGSEVRRIEKEGTGRTRIDAHCLTKFI